MALEVATEIHLLSMLDVLVRSAATYHSRDMREPSCRTLHAIVTWCCWKEKIVTIEYSVLAHMVDAVHRMADSARRRSAMMRIYSRRWFQYWQNLEWYR